MRQPQKAVTAIDYEGYPMANLFPALTQFLDSFYVFGGDFISLTISIGL